MPGDDKRLLDYFIEHTDARFSELKGDMVAIKDEMGKQHRGLSKQIRGLRKFGIAVAFLCIALSPKGEKLLDLIPKLYEVATAMAAGGAR